MAEENEMNSKKIEKTKKRKILDDQQDAVKTKKLPKCLPFPAELKCEIFASLPFENAFGLMVKMPNGLLAKNVRRMFNNFKKAMKANKWNAEDCASNLTVSKDGLELVHGNPDVINSVRALLPIPRLNQNANKKTYIAFYCELHILKQTRGNGIGIGFGDRQFILEGRLPGEWENSIGIYDMNGIWIDGSFDRFGLSWGNLFKEGDVVGLGLIYSPANSLLKCFASCNGELLASPIKLPRKFIGLKLFPITTLWDAGDSVRVNFGKEEWQFHPHQHFQSTILRRLCKADLTEDLTVQTCELNQRIKLLLHQSHLPECNLVKVSSTLSQFSTADVDDPQTICDRLLAMCKKDGDSNGKSCRKYNCKE